jgi:hypothetical protein
MRTIHGRLLAEYKQHEVTWQRGLNSVSRKGFEGRIQDAEAAVNRQSKVFAHEYDLWLEDDRVASEK